MIGKARTNNRYTSRRKWVGHWYLYHILLTSAKTFFEAFTYWMRNNLVKCVQHIPAMVDKTKKLNFLWPKPRVTYLLDYSNHQSKYILQMCLFGLCVEKDFKGWWNSQVIVMKNIRWLLIVMKDIRWLLYSRSRLRKLNSPKTAETTAQLI